MSGLVLLLGLILAADIKMDIKLTYEAPPEELVLTMPVGMGLDKNHYLYILDGETRSVLIWDKQGKYSGNVGREGHAH